MDAAIFYYTGTGNSLWVARTIADELGGAQLFPISGHHEREVVNSRIIGLVFPVHIWGVPAPVVRFVDTLAGLRSSYIFAIAVHAGQLSNTLIQLKKAMRDNDLKLSAGLGIQMPSNYIPWGGPGPEEKQRQLFALAKEKISRIAVDLKNQVPAAIEKGPLWQRILFTPIYNFSLYHVPAMDRRFWADNKCNKCEICVKVCPAGNITLRDGKPHWHHWCEQCFACLQWCPMGSIQYGKRTSKYKRYHHPEVKLADMLKGNERLHI